jgi:thiosulfate/3-mercaptopyruvate sulfurtransferase
MTSQNNQVSNLCSAEELNTLLSESKDPSAKQSPLSILDCSWYMPSQQINTAAAYQEIHVPGAKFFHIDEICNKTSDLPHMMPTPAKFSKAVQDLGVSSQSQIVVYDSAGLFSAARVWWMFRAFGHNNVRVLNGGLPAWIAMGGNVESRVESKVESTKPNGGASDHAQQATFTATAPADYVANLQEVQENCRTGECLVADARSLARFLGEAPEPRVGLSSGHMPNSVSLPFDDLINNGRLKSASELTEIFASRGITADTTLITSCGSGVTAAIITLALDECDLGMHRLYDGSWSEWASRDDTTILTG